MRRPAARGKLGATARGSGGNPSARARAMPCEVAELQRCKGAKRPAQAAGRKVVRGLQGSSGEGDSDSQEVIVVDGDEEMEKGGERTSCSSGKVDSGSDSGSADESHSEEEEDDSVSEDDSDIAPRTRTVATRRTAAAPATRATRAAVAARQQPTRTKRPQLPAPRGRRTQVSSESDGSSSEDDNNNDSDESVDSDNDASGSDGSASERAGRSSGEGEEEQAEGSAGSAKVPARPLPRLQEVEKVLRHDPEGDKLLIKFVGRRGKETVCRGHGSLCRMPISRFRDCCPRWVVKFISRLMVRLCMCAAVHRPPVPSSPPHHC